MKNRKPELGDRVRDKVTEFEGIVTSYSKHIAGCDRLWIEPTVNDKGDPRDGKWFDVDMLEVVEASVVDVVQYESRAPGGSDLPRSY